MDEVIKCWKYDPGTLPFMKAQAKFDEWINVRRVALQQLSKEWKDDPGIFEFLHDCAIHDPFERIALSVGNPRQTALEAIIKQFPQHPQTLPLLRDRAKNDPDEQVRKFAQKKLKQWEG
ncbi:HEAT repeat domain-containing protein [Nostoc sp.]|uniref:HEAT repeat domain-containing protein n=1 Tax=Nostoc sp. TaxID=1180 RepID=UPI002FF57BE0